MRPATVAAWPVRGLRIVRGRRRATENVPKPTSVTVSPRLSATRTAPSMARSARSVTVRGQPAASAMRLTSCARVTLHAEDGLRLVHHGLGDGGVALVAREPLDRAARHGADEGGNTVQPRLGLAGPRDGGGRRRRLRLAERRREGAAGAGRVAGAAAARQGVRPRA